MAITFPPQTEPFVRLLFDVNQPRGYQPRLDAANEPAEEAVRVIRSQLGLPPPDAS